MPLSHRDFKESRGHSVLLIQGRPLSLAKKEMFTLWNNVVLNVWNLGPETEYVGICMVGSAFQIPIKHAVTYS